MLDVPRKFPLADPLNKLKDTALGAVKDPKGTSDRLVGQAKGAASLGRHLAEGLAGQVAEQVSARTRGRRAADAPRAAAPPVETHAVPSPTPRKAQGDPLTPHPATAAPTAEPVPSTEARVTAKKATPADVAKKAAKKTPAKKAPAKKAPAKKAPAKKAAKKVAPAESAPATSTAKQAPAKKAATGAPGDKLPPRTGSAATPPPAPRDIEANPEAPPPAGP